ncbi:hypothetical protein [Enterovirga sp. CN4-39]|uniref:hypothetical protein n=1 Tax=Enterovirga sp. CN4-39 TaxID=3400910 RepID=UPI003BFECEC0
MLRKLVLPFLALSLLTGCAVETFTYTMDRYGEVKGVRVRLGCNDAYEVFDRKDAASFVVVTNPVNEAVAGNCPGLAGLPKAERRRRTAEIYLVETTSRPECRITRETPLTDFHTEYDYRCSDPRQVARASRRAPDPLR